MGAFYLCARCPTGIYASTPFRPVECGTATFLLYWYLVDPNSRNKRLLFDRDELAAQISEIVREPFTGQQLPIEDLRLKEDDRTFTFSIKGTNGNYFFSYDYPSSRLTRITKDEIPAKIRWANISPDKKRVVFAKDLNLYVMSY